MASWLESLKRYNAAHADDVEEKLSDSPSKDAAADAEALATARAARKEQRVLHELRQIYIKEAAAKAQELKRSKRADEKRAHEPASASSIPRFYIKRTTSPPPVDAPAASEGGEDEESAPAPAPAQSLATQLRREARTRYLIGRAEQLLDDRELGLLWETIQQHSVDTNTQTGAVSSSPSSITPSSTGLPSIGGSNSTGSGTNGPSSSATLFDVEKRLNYDSFLLVSHTLPSHKSSRYFKPSTFLLFPQDSHGRISSRALWRYITRKIQLTRLRISLTCYDDVGYGYLREQDLENYVYDQLATLPPLQSLERDFYPYYVFTAVRKFIFFLDPHRRGKLRIKTIVDGAVMLEFDALRYPHGHHQGTRKNSWFSSSHTQDVYAIYLGLDTNQNGMLSREEFKLYNGGNLTNIFIEGLFSEYRMYPSSSTNNNADENDSSQTQEDAGNTSGEDGNASDNKHELEMDYKTFLDFVLAMEYKTTPASIAYFFKILDFQHQGYLDTFTLNYWFRAVSEMAQLDREIVDVVANEIFDMVCPAVDGRITLTDLISSRCGHTVISILIDVNGFWNYDNRESLMHQATEEN